MDKRCHICRTYDDILSFLKENPDTPVIELDSIVGPTSGKVLLTIHFTDSLLMLAILRVANTSQSVIDVFERFYCDPSAPYQKGAAENNHEFIRRIIPKGTSFDDYDQSDINLMMSHISSYGREKLNDRSPYSVFSFLHGYELLKLVEYDNIHSPDNILLPRLLKK